MKNIGRTAGFLLAALTVTMLAWPTIGFNNLNSSNEDQSQVQLAKKRGGCGSRKGCLREDPQPMGNFATTLGPRGRGPGPKG